MNQANGRSYKFVEKKNSNEFFFEKMKVKIEKKVPSKDCQRIHFIGLRTVGVMSSRMAFLQVAALTIIISKRTWNAKNLFY
jgi:hypothetical protein